MSSFSKSKTPSKTKEVKESKKEEKEAKEIKTKKQISSSSDDDSDSSSYSISDENQINDDDSDEFEVKVINQPQNTDVLERAAQLQEKRAQGLLDEEDVSSSSESSSDVSEDDEAEMAGKIADEFLNFLPKLHSHHPDIYSKDKVFFPSEIEVEEKEKPKPGSVLTYEEMVRNDILEKAKKADDEDVDSDIEQEEFEKARKSEMSKLSYVQQQEMAKKEILKAAWQNNDESESDSEILLKKQQSEKEQQKFENEYQLFLKKQEEEEKKKKPSERQGTSILDYWKRKDLDENEQFLRDFILNKRWLGSGDNEADKTKILEEDEEDKEALEKQEDFETVYNFRFEEPQGHQLITHSRNQADSVRVVTNKRAEARAKKREKKRLEKLAAEQAKIEAKKQKKAEILQRLKELSEVAGTEEGIKKLVKDDAEWDSDEYDEKMAQIFNDEYYATKEEDIPKADIVDVDNIQEVEEWLKKVKKSGKDEKTEEISKAIEDYYNLDFEDVVGGDTVRFKYTEVPAYDYGLTNEELLNMSDSELDQLIPMKKLHTYREDGGYIKPGKIKHQRHKLALAGRTFVKVDKKDKKKKKNKEDKSDSKMDIEDDVKQDKKEDKKDDKKKSKENSSEKDDHSKESSKKRKRESLSNSEAVTEPQKKKIKK